MSKREFNTWISSFRDSIADYGYYIDFEKIHRNIDQIKIELNILNSLIGSKNIEFDFENLIKKYPEQIKPFEGILTRVEILLGQTKEEERKKERE